MISVTRCCRRNCMPDSKCSENVEGCLTAEDCATGTPNKSKSASLQYEHSRIYCYVLRLNVFDRDLHSNQNILHKKHVRSWVQPPLTVHTVTVFCNCISVCIRICVCICSCISICVSICVRVCICSFTRNTSGLECNRLAARPHCVDIDECTGGHLMLRLANCHK